MARSVCKSCVEGWGDRSEILSLEQKRRTGGSTGKELGGPQ